MSLRWNRLCRWRYRTFFWDLGLLLHECFITLKLLGLDQLSDSLQPRSHYVSSHNQSTSLLAFKPLLEKVSFLWWFFRCNFPFLVFFYLTWIWNTARNLITHWDVWLTIWWSWWYLLPHSLILVWSSNRILDLFRASLLVCHGWDILLNQLRSVKLDIVLSLMPWRIFSPCCWSSRSDLFCTS